MGKNVRIRIYETGNVVRSGNDRRKITYKKNVEK